MQQVPDKVFLDLQVTLIDIGNPGKRVHVLNHLAFGIVFDLSFFIPIRESRNRFQRTIFGHLFAGEIKFLAPRPINRP